MVFTKHKGEKARFVRMVVLNFGNILSSKA